MEQRLKQPNRILARLKRDWLLYVLLIPVLAWYLIFCYAPMAGVTLAFREFRYDTGLWHSPWVGLKWFKKMFEDPDVWRAIRNTVIFGLGRIAFQMPCAVALALLFNEIRNAKFKKCVQTLVTFPHFISWVVLSGILINLFASNGVINQLLGFLGLDGISPLASKTGFRPFVWLSGIWKEVGWDSIIYLAAITSIDPGLYEAADVDGANRFQRIWHITLPGIRGTICIMLILSVGSLMTNGSFDQIFNLYSEPVFAVADTLDTFIFRKSLISGGMNFGYSTAIGLFKSVIGVIMITISNKIVTKCGETGLF